MKMELFGLNSTEDILNIIKLYQLEMSAFTGFIKEKFLKL